ncbi:MAG: hypothetical protein FK733_12140 [Asgard group archaeon]|nr:hypothetical protein [Asgard group archaeon]
MIHKRKIILSTICILFVSTSFLYFMPDNTKSAAIHFFTVTATASNYEMLEYLNMIKQQLNHIGVNLDIFLCDCPDMWLPIVNGEFDLACVEFQNVGDLYFYINELYSENATHNLFGYHSDMDYSESLGMGTNEWYLNQLNYFYPPESQECYELCWEWQTYLLDKLLPCLPLFNEKEYLLIYDNLEGMNYKEGLLKSWGNLQWNGLHPGQTFFNEIIMADDSWTNLNPVFKNSSGTETFIENCIFDSLIQRDPDQTYWPHLTENWEYHTGNHVNLSIRENVKWQQDVDGLFAEEYLDVQDIYFSLYLYDMLHNLTWIDDFSIIDEDTIDLELNLDILDYRNVSFNYLDELMGIKILPEFYLNQTQLVDGITPDMNHLSWQKFSSNPFGTGLMQFTNFIEDVETLLNVFDDCWWLDNETKNDSSLNWDERYGTFQNSPTKLRIRILDEMERMLEFNQGRIDILPRTYDELQDFENNHYSTSEMELLSKPSNKYMALVFNLRETRAYTGNPEPSPLLIDYAIGLMIRKAIAYAIDREEINNVIYGGRMDINNWPMSPSLGMWCNPEIGNYCYNLDWARACMTSAGFDVCGVYEDNNRDTSGFPDWDKGCGNPDDSTIKLNLEYSYTLLIVIGLLFLFKRSRKDGRRIK